MGSDRINRALTAVALLAALALAAVVAAPAHGARLSVLGPHGRVTERKDPGVAARDRTDAPARPATHRRDRRTHRQERSATALARTSARKRTVRRQLGRLLHAGAIDRPTYDADRAEYRRDRRLARRLDGRRAVELDGVLDTLDGIAAHGQLTASRLPVLFLTLQRNREWWSTGPLLAYGQRVSFKGTELVWQYFPGEGLQFHPLANFGKLNALWRSRLEVDRMQALLDELLALPAKRAGGLAWEYYFDFDGGRPPWVSSLAQGTGLQSMARAAIKAGRAGQVMPILRKGLKIFQRRAPSGVRTSADGGRHYVQYSFAPHLRILNGFVQSLVGLYDFGRLAHDATAQKLFTYGERAARREVPRFDTGSWSLYSRGTDTHESDLNYHRVLIDFLTSLCDRTDEPTYCDAVTSFQHDLKTPPALRLLTRRLRAGQAGRLRFRLSKVSRVTVQLRRGGKLALSRTVLLGHGTHSLTVVPPRSTRAYDVTLRATDLADNAAQTVSDTVEVLKPRKR